MYIRIAIDTGVTKRIIFLRIRFLLRKPNDLLINDVLFSDYLT